MSYSHFRAKKELAEMISTAINAQLTDDEAQSLACDIVTPFLNKIESPFLSDLFQVGIQFREWLQDADIRNKDRAYDIARTNKLKKWLESCGGDDRL